MAVKQENQSILPMVLQIPLRVAHSIVQEITQFNFSLCARDNKLCYGLALDSRQNSYNNLDITVENNVMTGGCTITSGSTECNSYLYAHSDNAAWETVNVNNGKDNWGIYYPDAQ